MKKSRAKQSNSVPVSVSRRKTNQVQRTVFVQMTVVEAILQLSIPITVIM